MKRKILVAAGLVVIALAANSAHASIYLRIPKIAGDVRVVGHAHEIEVRSYELDVSNSKKKAVFNSLVLQMNFSSASSALFQAALTGDDLGTVVLSVIKSAAMTGGQAPSMDIVRITLQGAVILSYKSKSSGDSPTEEVTVGYSSIKFESAGRPQDEAGRPASAPPRAPARVSPKRPAPAAKH